MKFAKLFERDGQQLLVLLTYFGDEDETHVRLITEYASGIRTEKSLIYSGDTQTEDANNALESFTEEKAFEIIEPLTRLVGGV